MEVRPHGPFQSFIQVGRSANESLLRKAFPQAKPEDIRALTSKGAENAVGIYRDAGIGALAGAAIGLMGRKAQRMSAGRAALLAGAIGFAGSALVTAILKVSEIIPFYRKVLASSSH
jgi:hypothetical protein